MTLWLNKISTKDSRRGVTLVETMVAVSVLTLVSVGTIKLLTESNYTRGRAKERSVAGLLAVSELEALRSLNGTELQIGMTSTTLTTNGISYLSEREITPYNEQLLQLQVTVSREGQRGNTSVSLTTLKEKEVRP